MITIELTEQEAINLYAMGELVSTLIHRDTEQPSPYVPPAFAQVENLKGKVEPYLEQSQPRSELENYCMAKMNTL